MFACYLPSQPWHNTLPYHTYKIGYTVAQWCNTTTKSLHYLHDLFFLYLSLAFYYNLIKILWLELGACSLITWVIRLLFFSTMSEIKGVLFGG